MHEKKQSKYKPNPIRVECKHKVLMEKVITTNVEEENNVCLLCLTCVNIAS